MGWIGAGAWRAGGFVGRGACGGLAEDDGDPGAEEVAAGDESDDEGWRWGEAAAGDMGVWSADWPELGDGT